MAGSPTLGRHTVHNALAAAAVGLAAGLPVDEHRDGPGRGVGRRRIAALLARRGPVTRSSTTRTTPSPRSMAAALELLADLPGRHVAVLGEMLELGEARTDGHREVGAAAAAARSTCSSPSATVPLEIADGALAAGLARRAVDHVPDATTPRSALRRRLRPGDVVLVKASRGARSSSRRSTRRLERLADLGRRRAGRGAG